ncbi:MAG: DUF5060 domain-containing protein [Anaerolineae bacterium]|nr:DUF5060 domain-containing protein [Anaerolineae bacterium]
MLNSYRRVVCFLVVTAVLLAACGEGAETATAVPTTSPTATTAPTPTAPENLPTGNLPAITAVSLDHPSLPRYESLEMTLAVTAEYSNPYDAREVTLDGLFTAPDGSEMTVPGFWDGEEAWRVRFTPSQGGDWRYRLLLTDANGTSQPTEGTFTVTASDHHGWLQAGDWVNPDYSGHYLVYHDGTPFYGLGHADALNILIDGFNIDGGVGLFRNMVEAGENYVVWWPLYSVSPVNNSYDDYSVANLTLIDTVVKDAQAKGVFLIFTIWDHPQLRDNTHDWGTGNWVNNGFNKLTDLESFFTDDEAWAWQENLYRYIIARWGYSPAIGLWQTVSEINGTNAYDQTDPWHEKVNAYFAENDPYRHPTTASRSGDVDWEAGHLAMDAPQVHLYDFDNDAVGAAQVLADWTSLMFNRAEKPNWVGEFGVTGNSYYPELFHNSIWAALATGAAMTPAEWNSGGSWMRMSSEMLADLSRLGAFVADLPLAQLKPTAVTLTSSDPEVRGWGVIGADGGLFWVQDFALEGAPIDQVRADETVRQGVSVSMVGMAAGVYEIRPYHTWQGTYLDAFTVACLADQPCTMPLPDFADDMAFKVIREMED